MTKVISSPLEPSLLLTSRMRACVCTELLMAVMYEDSKVNQPSTSGYFRETYDIPALACIQADELDG